MGLAEESLLSLNCITKGMMADIMPLRILTAPTATREDAFVHWGVRPRVDSLRCRQE
jgi:hypothetical protein